LKTKDRSSVGFTLIELLVVIAILAVLGGLSFAALGQARDSSNRAKCLAHMRQLSSAQSAVIADRDGVLREPDASWYSPQLDSYLGIGNRTVEERIQYYQRISCPSALAKFKALGYTYTVPRASYGYNAYVADTKSVVKRMAGLVRPAATVMIGDGEIRKKIDGFDINLAKDNVTPYHGDKCAICYFDGHAELVTPEFVASMESTMKTPGSPGSIFWYGQ
jgi:prepilin-type N-terminal cleavage/methylation domain-containing protein/prepilin-type processing-associated H-X9-DG protein